VGLATNIMLSPLVNDLFNHVDVTDVQDD